VARGWSSAVRGCPRRLRVAWPAMLAVVVVLGGAACGGDAQGRAGDRVCGRCCAAAGGGDHGAVGADARPDRRLARAGRDGEGPVAAAGALPARPGARWPVLYLLHGCCDTYRSWTRSTDVAALTAHSDVLVVMPDGGKAGFYSDWLPGRAGKRSTWPNCGRSCSGTTAPAQSWRSPASRWAAWAPWPTPPAIAACSAPPRPSAGSPAPA
jgi:hypothetical protein